MPKRRKMSRSCALRYVVLILNILMIAINLPKFLAKPSAFLFSRRSTVKYVVSSKTLLSMQSRSTLQRHSSTSFSQYFHPIKGGGKIVSPLLFSERFGGDVALRDSDREILRATRNWINRVVVGLSLCPFAEKPIKDGKLSIYVVRGGYDSYPGWNYDGSRSRRKSWKKSSNDASGEDASNKNNPEPLDPIGSKLLTEMLRLAPDDVSGTSIIVVPDLYPNDFQSFLSYLSEQVEENIMDPYDLHGMLQIAPFHPEFMFGGSTENGNSAENCTNRSPYPMFHILKEIEVDRAVQRLDGDAGKVWRRNVKIMNYLGFGGLQKVLDGTKVKGSVLPSPVDVSR
eukprot:CAMPEP_0194335028 /NCGR_PEP_ID=MMETSP0171-20130528/68137_1 /TAXON_ID=218684 /ORGANISM="Corethron pennatum, Strain L29A3" /LENGTH=340 /DNA_ID=CAMNT_0039097925 /DNA_START=30 /DNA_END=1055 /DNA_ORIENTATION=+